MAARTRRTTTRRAASIEVTVAQPAQDAVTIRLKPGSTVDDALKAAGFHDDLEAMLAGVRVDNQEAKLGQRLRNGQLITISPNVEGGS